MKIIIPLISAVVLALAGCAGFDGRGLVPGQSTASEVEARMGPASDQRTRPDGETWLYYPRQPYGYANYVARIGSDGRLIALEQRLTDDNVARIERGKARSDEVRELIGEPYRITQIPRMSRDIWEYRMYSVQSVYPFALYVQFSPDGVAREVYLLSDPDYRLSDCCNP